MQWKIAAALSLLLAASTAAPAAAACDRPAVVRTPAAVYDSPPRFSSAKGWQPGRHIAQLAPGTPVRICQQVDVGLFFNKKRWYRIAFGQGQFGWVYAGVLETASAAGPFTLLASLAGPAVALADSGLPDSGLPGFGRTALLVVSFACVLLGMVAKVLYDAVATTAPDVPLRKVVGWRRLVLPLILAPMVFAGFLQFGDMTIPQQGGEKAVIVFLIMAFQNGFFWQTFFPDKRKQTDRTMVTT